MNFWNNFEFFCWKMWILGISKKKFLNKDLKKFENDYGYPPQDIKIAGKDLKFFTFTI